MERLWAALAAGGLDAVTSDHAPWTVAAKDRPDLFDAPSGAPGVEVLLPLFLDMARRRQFDITTAIALITEGPARCYGLAPRKGSLTVGADADIVAYDPSAARIVDAAAHQSIAAWSPFRAGRTGAPSRQRWCGLCRLRRGGDSGHAGAGHSCAQASASVSRRLTPASLTPTIVRLKYSKAIDFIVIILEVVEFAIASRRSMIGP